MEIETTPDYEIDTGYETNSDRLRRYVDHLEELVIKLELSIIKLNKTNKKKVNYLSVSQECFSELFIKEIQTKYWNLIQSYCRDYTRRLGVLHISEEDFIQESMEYIIRWCLPKSMEFSTEGKLWIPYLKRSINNCYVNLLKKHNSQRRRGYTVELTDVMVNSIVDESTNIQEDYEYLELISKVNLKLDKTDSKRFNEILNPTIALKTFIVIYQTFYEKGVKRSSRRMLSEYYGTTIGSINAMFSRFKVAIKECGLEIAGMPN